MLRRFPETGRVQFLNHLEEFYMVEGIANTTILSMIADHAVTCGVSYAHIGSNSTYSEACRGLLSLGVLFSPSLEFKSKRCYNSVATLLRLHRFLKKYQDEPYTSNWLEITRVFISMLDELFNEMVRTADLSNIRTENLSQQYTVYDFTISQIDQQDRMMMFNATMDYLRDGAAPSL